MRISDRTNKAILVMLELGLNSSEDQLISLPTISDKLGMSVPYLEKLFTDFRRKCFVRGNRGPGGGYCLAKEPSDINIAQIMGATDELMEFTYCSDTNPYKNRYKTEPKELLERLNKNLFAYLDAITLADLIDNR
jgi:Rrf2 family iron-sulfur cluster assembly transcriptional regulator